MLAHRAATSAFAEMDSNIYEGNIQNASEATKTFLQQFQSTVDCYAKNVPYPTEGGRVHLGQTAVVGASCFQEVCSSVVPEAR